MVTTVWFSFNLGGHTSYGGIFDSPREIEPHDVTVDFVIKYYIFGCDTFINKDKITFQLI